MRAAGALLLAAFAGFLLGACGGGGGGTALSTRTGTTRTESATLPTRTRTAAAPETTTVEVATTVAPTTTVAPPPTTRPPLTITVAPPPTTSVETTTAAAPPPTTTAPPAPPTTTAAEPAASTNTPWGWIALVLALAGVGVLVIGLWSRRRSRASSWSSRSADLRRRTLIALDDVLERGSVVTGQAEALAAEARSLEAGAPDERERAEAGRLRESLDELVRTLEADRALRLGSPPPTPEQLSYSTALIRQQVEQLQGVLRARAPDAPK
jgi:hypothetical protein